MKILSLILALTFSMQAFSSTVKEGLEKALNEYEYSMVVEWDQKDQAAAEKFTHEFSLALQNLKDQGLTHEELLSYIEGRVKDKEKFETIKASAALSGKNASSAMEIAKVLESNMEHMGLKGASWNGSVAYLLAAAPIILLTALIINTYIWNTSHRCVAAHTYESCGYETYCTDYDYDYDGNQYCEDYDTEYSCSDVERCDEWEKIPGK